jgi:hypothetical protein
VLVKMAWSSAQDAEFISETLSCFTADEVFTQLKASARITDDLLNPFGLEGTCKEKLDVVNKQLVIRKWHEGHNKGMEFRAFVRDGKLVGLS